MTQHATLHFSLEELVYDPLFEYIERTVYYDREYKISSLLHVHDIKR